MTLEEKINNDMKEALKAKDKNRLDAIRAVKSEILLAKTAEGSTGTVSSELEIRILQKMVKQRKDAATIYTEQNRADLAEKELLEAKFIEVYLPAQLSDDELKTILLKIIADSGASSAKDMGKVIGLANKQLAGQAEGKRIADLVKALLAS